MLEFMPGATGIAVAAGAVLFISGFIAAKRLCGNAELEKYEFFVEDMEDGYYRSSLDGKQLYANKALVRLNGYETQEEMLASVNDIATEWYVDPKRRDRFSQLLHENGSVNNFVSEIYRHKSRERIWISETARLMLSKDGRPSHYEGTIREMSDTVRRLELEKLYRKFAEHAPGAMVQGRWSKDGKFSLPFSTRCFDELLGELPGSVEDDAAFLFKMLHREDFETFVQTGMASAKNCTPWVVEFRVNCTNGRLIWLELKASPERESDGSTLWHGFLMDVTERKIAEQRIRDLADLDPLTGLLNRGSARRAIRSARREAVLKGNLAALLLIDLDNFNMLNIEKGHARGDLVLVNFGKRLQECAGKNADVARLGSDGFAIILRELDSDRALAGLHVQETAKRLMRAVGQPFIVDDEICQVSCSVGTVIFDQSQTPDEDLIRSANIALRVAKLDGKNQYVAYKADMVSRVEEETGKREWLMKTG